MHLSCVWDLLDMVTVVMCNTLTILHSKKKSLGVFFCIKIGCDELK